MNRNELIKRMEFKIDNYKPGDRQVEVSNGTFYEPIVHDFLVIFLKSLDELLKSPPESTQKHGNMFNRKPYEFD